MWILNSKVLFLHVPFFSEHDWNFRNKFEIFFYRFFSKLRQFPTNSKIFNTQLELGFANYFRFLNFIMGMTKFIAYWLKLELETTNFRCAVCCTVQEGTVNVVLMCNKRYMWTLDKKFACSFRAWFLKQDFLVRVESASIACLLVQNSRSLLRNQLLYTQSQCFL